MEKDSKRSSSNLKGYMTTQRGINKISLSDQDFYAAKVFLETMKEHNGDWFVGNKLWNVLTPEQQRLILFQRHQYMNQNKNNQNYSQKDQRQNSGYTQNKDNSQIPPNLKVNDAIVRPPIKKEGLQKIPK